MSTPAFKNFGAGTPFLIEGEFYRWNLSRCGRQVHMHTGAVRRIAYDLMRKTTAKAPSDLGGLLLGECRKLVPRTFRVMGVEPCDAEIFTFRLRIGQPAHRPANHEWPDGCLRRFETRPASSCWLLQLSP